MISSTLLDLDSMYYYWHHLYEIADSIGLDSSVFVLESWESDVKKLYRKYKALLRLRTRYGKEQFEKAAQRANFYMKQDPSSLMYILKNGLQKLPLTSNTDIEGQGFIHFD